MIIKGSKHSFKMRFYVLFVFYTLIFLFYPGNSYHFDIFAFNRDLFNTNPEQQQAVKIKPIPYLKSTYYPFIQSEGIYVVDLDSFTPIFERNAHSKFFPASTTKVVTALTAYDLYKPDDVVTVKNVKSEGHTMGLVEGERITVENLLYGMLVYSGNDAAYALAQVKDYNQFIQLMNDKAKKLHMVNTHFSNPAGLDQDNHYSSPFDLALAAREFLRNKYLSKFVSIKEITVSDEDFKYFHKLTNINKLLGEVQGLGGLKTGFTENARENLISFFKHGDRNYIIVVLRSEDRFEDTKTVINWIKTNIDHINL